jgi:hypothetical protein
VEAVMAETDREEAKRRRAEARKRRREGAQEQAGEPESTEQGNSETPEALDSVKHAAKVAAAAAAVGAAVGAARALTGNGSPDEEHAEPPAATQEPEAEAEPEAEREPEPEPEDEQPQPREQEEDRHEEDQPQPESRYDEGQPTGASPDEARRVVASAREALAALLGKEPDSVSGLDRNGDGWLVTLEVVELPRVPESTDVLASYDVELDGDRKLVRYQRGRRYRRSQADDGEVS